MPTSAPTGPIGPPARRAHAAHPPDEPPTPAAVGTRILVAFGVLVAACSLLGLLVVHGLDSTLGDTDRQLVQDVVDGRTAGWDRLTGWATWLTDTVPVAVVWALLVAAVYGWTRHWVAPVAVMAAIGGEKLSYLVTSFIVDRPRPDVPPLGVVHATTSFPSGHTASAVTLYGVLVLLAVWSGHLRRRGTRLLAWLGVAAVVVLVAVSRVYRGHHYPSDVVVGAALGVCWLVVTWVWVLRDQPAPQARSAHRPHQPPASNPS